MDEAESRSGIPIKGEIYRKVTHLVALVLPLTAWEVGGKDLLPLVAPLSLIALLADWLRVRSEVFKRFIDTVFGSMMREWECPPIGNPMHVNGATWTLLSFSMLLFVFEMPVAVTAFTVFMVGDAAAALIGRKLGRRHWGRTGCTVEGSVAFLVFGLAVAVAIGGGGIIQGTLFAFPFWAVFVATLAGCIAEASPLRINDNLVSPFATALALATMLYFLEESPIRLFPEF